MWTWVCGCAHVEGRTPCLRPMPTICLWSCCLGGACSLMEWYGPVPRFVLENPFVLGAASLSQDLEELEEAMTGVDMDQV